MMTDIRIERFEERFSEKWDKFVLQHSYNGTFLQTRNFLNYHPEGRFEDCSLVFYRGQSDILAVIPAAFMHDGGQKIFWSHPGSTFGGMIFNRQFYNIQHVEAALNELEYYLRKQAFDKAVLKQTAQIFCDKANDLIEYFYFQKGWLHYSEISFVIDLNNYLDDVPSNYVSARRRGYQYSEKNGLVFRKMGFDEIGVFYSLLSENLKKFDAVPVHTLEELQEFKRSRLTDTVDFYGSFKNDKLVAGTMVFYFGKDVFHTQYLAASQKDLNLYPNNHMDTYLIMLAREMGFRYFSFGISTEEQGKVLNKHLAAFKEGFGTTYRNNKAWYKNF